MCVNKRRGTHPTAGPGDKLSFVLLRFVGIRSYRQPANDTERNTIRLPDGTQDRDPFHLLLLLLLLSVSRHRGFEVKLPPHPLWLNT